MIKRRYKVVHQRIKCHKVVWTNFYVAANSIYTDLKVKSDQKVFIGSFIEKLKVDYKNFLNKNNELEGLTKQHLNKFFDDLIVKYSVTENELAKLYEGYWAEDTDYFEIVEHVKFSKFKTIFKRFYQDMPNIFSLHDFEPIAPIELKLAGNVLCKF